MSPADATPHAVTGAPHYYPSLPQPQPVYFIIDQSVGIYPSLSSASVGAGTVLTTSGYVAPVPPMIAPPMQSAGVVLGPGMIPAPAAQTRNLIPPALLRPGLIQQSPAPGVIMPSGLVPAPPTAAIAPLPATSIMPAHGTLLPLPSHMPVPALNELSLNASSSLAAGYSGQPLLVSTNGLDSQPVNAMPVDGRVGNKSRPHDAVYISTVGRNVNNSAAERSEHSTCDTTLPVGERTSPSCVGPVDTPLPVNEHTSPGCLGPADIDASSPCGNGLAACDESAGSDASLLAAERPEDVESSTVMLPVNGELSVDASQELGSSSDSSSVTSPTLNDTVADRDVTLSKDDGLSAVMSASSPQSSATAVNATASSTAVKSKAPSWASLLKDTTAANNAIVIGVSDGPSMVTQQKADMKSVTKEPVTQQSSTSAVTNHEQLKLDMSGLYLLGCK